MKMMDENVTKLLQTDDKDISPSAFRRFISQNVDMKKRDSGYGTDFSPASVSSTSRRFTFDDLQGEECELSKAIQDMNIEEDPFTEDVLSVTAPRHGGEEDVDKEVAELCSEREDHSVSKPVSIRRPSAPLPTPEEELSDEEEKDGHRQVVTPIFFQFSRYRDNTTFRPIVSRTVGTQTPSPVSHVSSSCDGHGYGRRMMARGTAIRRLNFQSVTEDTDPGTNGPLPDLVPLSRDRSVSLPNVPAFRQEQAVGRTLRRISDEFNSSFRRTGRRRTVSVHASSLPTTCWNSIRGLWNASPLGRRTTDIYRAGSPVDPEYYNPPNDDH